MMEVSQQGDGVCVERLALAADVSVLLYTHLLWSTKHSEDLLSPVSYLT